MRRNRELSDLDEQIEIALRTRDATIQRTERRAGELLVALRARAKQHQQSVEAEAREILTDALDREPRTLVDLLGTDGADIEFQPERLGLIVAIPDL